MSPVKWSVPPGCRVEAWVGAEESSEYLRQSRELAETWRRAGARAAFQAIPGANHFTAIAPLADTDSDMVQTIVDMAMNGR